MIVNSGTGRIEAKGTEGSMSGNHIEEAQQALLKLAHVASQIEGRCIDATQKLDASARSMLEGAQRLGDGVNHFNLQAMTAIRQGTQAAVTESAGTALTEMNRELEKYASLARAAASALGEQSQALSLAQRTLVWKGLLTLAAGSLLIAGGSAYVARKSMQEIRQAEFSQAILRATQSGALATCGKQEDLCVKMGPKPRRAGQHGEYVMVEP